MATAPAPVHHVGSVCETRAPSTTGTIEWRIQWSSLPWDHVVDGASQGRIYSKTMEAAGDKWQIEVNPGGSSDSRQSEGDVQYQKQYVTIYLVYKGDSEALRAKYSITLVNQWRPGLWDQTFDAHVVTFGRFPSATASNTRGFRTFMFRPFLENEYNGWKVNDRVIIRATITTFGDLETTVAAVAPAFTPPNTVAADLKSMLDSGYKSDITFYCGHREFAAHRSILGARSPYFKGLFASTMRDADSDDLPITDIEPDVFEQLLLWVYAGEVTEAALRAKDMLEHLLMAANRYECVGLKLLCEAKLCEGLSVENAAMRLVLAEQAGAAKLKEACLELIKLNAAAVMGTTGWTHVASNIELVNEVLTLVAGAPTAGKGKGKGKKRIRGEDDSSSGGSNSSSASGPGTAQYR